MKNVTVSLDDATYRNARRRAAEADRSLSSVVREALQSYGAEESEFDRLKRMQEELLDRLDREGRGFDPADRLSREELHDRDRARDDCRDAYL